MWRAFGDAPVESRYVMFSATKAVVAGAVWILIGEGALDVSRPVASLIPEFAPNGKDAITVEQVMLHTSGFPRAPFGNARLGRPRPSARAVLAVALQLGAGDALRVPPHDRALGARGDHRAPARAATSARSCASASSSRSGSAGLQVGVPIAQQGDINDLVLTGEATPPDELEAAIGIRELPLTEVTPDALMSFNQPERARGRRSRRRRRVDRGRPRARTTRRCSPTRSASGSRKCWPTSTAQRAQPHARLHGDSREPHARARRRR